MVGELFLIDDPKELGALVRDTSRYEGTLSQEDLYELGEFLHFCGSPSLSPSLSPKLPSGKDAFKLIETGYPRRDSPTPSRLAKD